MKKNIMNVINSIRLKRHTCQLDDDAAIKYFESVGSITDTSKWMLVDDSESNKLTLAKEDNVEYRVVYYYKQLRNGKGPSRRFCESMMSMDKEYTKEEIMAFNSDIENPGFGPNGGGYDIFLYKGGVNCGHAWYRRTYKSVDGGEEEKISTGQARREGYRDPPNPTEVSIAPYNMPNHASLK